MLKKRERRMAINNKVYPTYTLEQAINYVITIKESEGLRERSLIDYSKHWGYFISWVEKNYEIHEVAQITTEIIRNHVNYMKHDAKRYDGHKHIVGEHGIGLSDTTINIRLRTLKAIFNQLERDEIIEINPTYGIKLMRTDEDLVESLTIEQIKVLLSQPNQKDVIYIVY